MMMRYRERLLTMHWQPFYRRLRRCCRDSGTTACGADRALWETNERCAGNLHHPVRTMPMLSPCIWLSLEKRSAANVQGNANPAGPTRKSPGRCHSGRSAGWKPGGSRTCLSYRKGIRKKFIAGNRSTGTPIGVVERSSHRFAGFHL
jgi:hypothetical protein